MLLRFKNSILVYYILSPILEENLEYLSYYVGRASFISYILISMIKVKTFLISLYIIETKKFTFFFFTKMHVYIQTTIIVIDDLSV